MRPLTTAPGDFDADQRDPARGRSSKRGRLRLRGDRARGGRVLRARPQGAAAPTSRRRCATPATPRPTPPGAVLLDIMLENVDVAERDTNLVCQDTGTVVFWLEVARLRAEPGQGDRGGQAGHRARHARAPVAAQRRPPRDAAEHAAPTPAATCRSCTTSSCRATTSFRPTALRLRCLPKGSGSENMSFLKMLIPADGVRGGQTLRPRVHRRGRPQAVPADHRRRRAGRHERPLHRPGQEGRAAPAGQPQRRSGDRRARRRAVRGRERARHRADGPRRHATRCWACTSSTPTRTSPRTPSR